METNNMNAEGENTAAPSCAPSTAPSAAGATAIASAAEPAAETAAPQTRRITSFFQREEASTGTRVFFFHPPAASNAAAAGTAADTGNCCRQQQSFASKGYHTPLLSHPLITTSLQVCGSDIPPPGLSPPGDLQRYHTLVYHPPLGDRAARSVITHPNLSPPFMGGAACLLSPGLHKITHPPQDITPGVTFSKRRNVIPGGCYLV